MLSRLDDILMSDGRKLVLAHTRTELQGAQHRMAQKLSAPAMLGFKT